MLKNATMYEIMTPNLLGFPKANWSLENIQVVTPWSHAVDPSGSSPQ